METIQNHYLHLLSEYSSFKDTKLSGRYLPYDSIKPSLERLGKYFPIQKIGFSTLGEPIETITIGNGDFKILAWSQMHGNESTTTKAVFDIVNAFMIFPEDPFLVFLKKHITLKIIPMLNPDGGFLYQRENVNGVDLNRDAKNLSEKESIVLRNAFETFKPRFCFNLHDQRSIFSAGELPLPATLSFLTPAMDASRAVTPARAISMKVIAAVAAELQLIIPGQIGRYDDAYNSNCTGDTFQTLGTPTILFEAGHYPEDYMREETRRLIVIALFSALNAIATENFKSRNIADYFAIPENQKLFYDVILRNASIQGGIADVAIQYRETLQNEEILFVPFIEKIAGNLPFFGHREINCAGKDLKTLEYQSPCENDIVNKLLLNNEVLVIN
ncbi:MAG: M14 family zinc carboxypeptidase [Gillisia sp.]